MVEYSGAQEAKDMQDLEYLMSCREFISSNRKQMADLNSQLEARDARNKPVLEYGSPERKEVESKLATSVSMEESLRKNLSEVYNMSERYSHALTAKIESLQTKYPDYAKKVAEIRQEYAIQQGLQKPSATPDKGKETTYDQLYGQSSNDVKDKKEEPVQKDDYESLYDDKPDNGDKPKEQGEPDRDNR